MQPVERNVSMNMGEAVIFILNKRALHENPSVYVYIAVTRGHHLTCKTCESEIDFVGEACDAPR